MSRLTPKQKKFADEYIITGNATESAKKAGYSEKTARFIGNENLTKPNIVEYIQERTKSIEEAKKMDLQEAIRLSSEIARGEVQKGYSKQYDIVKGKVTKEIEYEYTPTIEERQKSLEHIMRIHGAFVEKKELSGNVGLVQIIDNIPDDDDDG